MKEKWTDTWGAGAGTAGMYVPHHGCGSQAATFRICFLLLPLVLRRGLSSNTTILQ